MLLELMWKNPNPPKSTEMRLVRDKCPNVVTGERRYVAYWGVTAFFNVRCVVFEVIEGSKTAA